MELFTLPAKEIVLVLLKEAIGKLLRKSLTKNYFLFARQNHNDLCPFAARARNRQATADLFDAFLHAAEPKAAVAVIDFESNAVISKI